MKPSNADGSASLFIHSEKCLSYKLAAAQLVAATCHLLSYTTPVSGAFLHNAYLTFRPALPAMRNQAHGERKGVCPLPRQLPNARYLKLMAVIKATLKVANGTFKY